MRRIKEKKTAGEKIISFWYHLYLPLKEGTLKYFLIYVLPYLLLIFGYLTFLITAIIETPFSLLSLPVRLSTHNPKKLKKLHWFKWYYTRKIYRLLYGQ